MKQASGGCYRLGTRIVGREQLVFDYMLYLREQVVNVSISADALNRHLHTDADLLVQRCADGVVYLLTQPEAMTQDLTALANSRGSALPIFLVHLNSPNSGHSLSWVQCRREKGGKEVEKALLIPTGASAYNRATLMAETPEPLQAFVASIEEQATELRIANQWLLRMRATLRDSPIYEIG